MKEPPTEAALRTRLDAAGYQLLALCPTTPAYGYIAEWCVIHPGDAHFAPAFFGALPAIRDWLDAWQAEQPKPLAIEELPLFAKEAA